MSGKRRWVDTLDPKIGFDVPTMRCMSLFCLCEALHEAETGGEGGPSVWLVHASSWIVSWRKSLDHQGSPYRAELRINNEEEIIRRCIEVVLRADNASDLRNAEFYLRELWKRGQR